MGHAVIWWSSNFSHRHKAYRPVRSKVVGPRSTEKVETTSTRRPANFDLRLITTPPYTRNVSLARLRNHRQFSRRFLAEARALITTQPEKAPDRIVVSLPPLGTADAAFAIRESLGGSRNCQVIVDIMDAWPETFYRILPASLRKCGKLLLFPLHAASHRAFRGADRISAVSQIYIDLAKTSRGSKVVSHGSESDTHLCYHGIDIDKYSPAYDLRPTTHDPFKITYIGALERSYDLETAIRAIQELNREGDKVQFHIAGAGAHEASIRSFASSYLHGNSFHFHGLLDRTALATLLANSHAGLIPMRQDSFVGLPYKLADYCAAGLPVISSLDGECRRLLETKNAGLYYEPGVTEILKSVIRELLQNPNRRSDLGHNARAIAEKLFDRSKTYPQLAQFILGG